jgi:HEAT repeat protein
MRIWVGKVGTAVRRGQYRRAELWLRAVLDASTFPEHRRAEVDDSLAQISSSEIMSAVVQKATEGGEAAPAVRLLTALGTRAVNVLIELLADEQDAARRRMLVDILSEVARDDPTPLTARLNDSRWFLVRNIVIVLRHTGDREAIRLMKPVLSYSDHRVRLEALRGLAMLGDEAVPIFETALGDDHQSVRQTAIALLGTQGTVPAERLLVGALDRRSLDLSEKQRVVELLGERPGSAARDALEQLARKRFTFSSSTRILRRSAKDALKGSSA